MISKTGLRLSCALCQSEVAGEYQVQEEDTYFCCKGCQVVYNILLAQGALANFQDNPIYQQALKGGIITNPMLHFPKGEEELIPIEDFQKMHLTIQNMWCPSCAQVIFLLLMREKGVKQCVVDYSTDLACIEYTPRLISQEKIFKIIQQLGYEPLHLKDPRQKTISRTLILRLIVAAFFAINVMMFAYPIYATYFNQGDGEKYALFFAWLSLIGSIPVIVYSGWPIWRRFVTGMRVGIWGMETLVAMGVFAATALSLYELWKGSPYVYFDSITVIILFVLLGKILESHAKFSAKDSLIKLTLGLPRKGRKRFDNGEERFVSIKEIQSGEYLVVHMGEKIVLDGIVEEGSGTCDESLMTGESIPIMKEKGSIVLAGTFLQQGSLVIKVGCSLEESTLQKIIDMVCQDIGHKSKYVRAADEIVKWFVPSVIGLALATVCICLSLGIADQGQSIVQTAWIRGVAILLISCPCAVGIAAPVAESYLLNAMAKMGILVRNRGCLPFLGKETIFVFDKTGTVTEGKFQVVSGLEFLTFEEKRALKGLISQSIHPIAVALEKALLLPTPHFEKIEEKVGKGIEGVFEGVTYSLGSASFFEQLGIAIPFSNEQENNSILTTVFFAKDFNWLASIQLGDQIKPGIREFIQSLASTKRLLVSGDGESPVARVAKICHFQEWKSGYHPFQKKNLVEDLKKQGEIVAMLGDGMNDAPALTSAHIGIAVVSASDFSIQVSDLLLTTQQFQSLSYLRALAMKGRKIVKQNLFWAFFYNVIGLGLAAFGLLTPLFAAFAMVVSSLIVLLNAQRLSCK